MESEYRTHKLKTLKTIAETLNQATDMDTMLELVLKELLTVTRLQTGWIYLVNEKGEYFLAADYQLPPALIWDGKKPMCQGGCWCLDRYKDGRLKRAANIIECKRLEEAIELNWGDTKGITHHATVPLKAGEEKFGLLNVAAPNKKKFTDDELAVLEAVSFQIGTAIKRIRLFHKEQKRAQSFQKLGEVSAEINTERIEESFYTSALRVISEKFKWKYIILEFASNKRGQQPEHSEKYSEIEAPFSVGETTGKLTVYHEMLDEVDKEVIHLLADHVAVAFENIRLDQKGKELALIEERNRMARDLHDSVNQLLFSLQLTIRGTKEIAKEKEIKDSLTYMQELSQEALKEMRALIWQLRPSGLEQGVVSALRNHAGILDLTLEVDVLGVHDNIPNTIEECLWRIGQEALNNVKKHANSPQARITLILSTLDVEMTIKDNGRGFNIDEMEQSPSIGLASMKERAELLGGTLVTRSKLGEGTSIKVLLPLKGRR